VEKYSQTPPELEATKNNEVRVAGRLVSFRLMGKLVLRTCKGRKRIQIYVKKDVVGEQGFQLFSSSDWRFDRRARAPVSNQDNELSIWVSRFSFFRKRCFRCRKNGTD